MDFGFSDEQQQLRAAVRDYLSKEAPVSFARAMCEEPSGMIERVWRQLADLGWLGLTVDERYGGSAMGMLDLVVLLEEAGSVVFPGPLMSTLALAIPTIARTATEAQCAALLGPVIAGQRRATVAIAEDAGQWNADSLGLAVRREGGGYRLAGTKLFVPDARSADTIIVVARSGQGLGFFAVPADAGGLRLEPMKTIDETRKLDVVELVEVYVDGDAVLGDREHPASVLDELVDVAKLALSAEMCGGADAALNMSVEYAKIRSQFGRVIGSFQAIQHRLADMKVMVENARSLVYYAAWTIDQQSDDRRLACAMAKAYASDACTRVAADAIQVHGGIAFTWEHDMHLYFKRLKGDEHTYGDATVNREEVARLLAL